jgi:hypothetical protein
VKQVAYGDETVFSGGGYQATLIANLTAALATIHGNSSFKTLYVPDGQAITNDLSGGVLQTPALWTLADQTMLQSQTYEHDADVGVARTIVAVNAFAAANINRPCIVKKLLRNHTFGTPYTLTDVINWTNAVGAGCRPGAIIFDNENRTDTVLKQIIPVYRQGGA